MLSFLKNRSNSQASDMPFANLNQYELCEMWSPGTLKRVLDERKLYVAKRVNGGLTYAMKNPAGLYQQDDIALEEFQSQPLTLEKFNELKDLLQGESFNVIALQSFLSNIIAIISQRNYVFLYLEKRDMSLRDREGSYIVNILEYQIYHIQKGRKIPLNIDQNRIARIYTQLFGAEETWFYGDTCLTVAQCNELITGSIPHYFFVEKKEDTIKSRSQLPSEQIIAVCHYLDISDLYRFARANKECYGLITHRNPGFFPLHFFPVQPGSLVPPVVDQETVSDRVWRKKIELFFPVLSVPPFMKGAPASLCKLFQETYDHAYQSLSPHQRILVRLLQNRDVLGFEKCINKLEDDLSITLALRDFRKAIEKIDIGNRTTALTDLFIRQQSLLDFQYNSFLKVFQNNNTSCRMEYIFHLSYACNQFQNTTFCFERRFNYFAFEDNIPGIAYSRRAKAINSRIHIYPEYYISESRALKLGVAKNKDASVLCLAAHYGFNELLQDLILDPDVAVNATDLQGNTALHLAARDGRVSAVQLLLTSPAIDVNAEVVYSQSSQAFSPCLLAASFGHRAVVAAIVEDPRFNKQSPCYSQGYTPLYAAALWGHARVIDYLSKITAADGNFLFDVNKSCISDVGPYEYFSPLFCAAFHGHQAAVEKLLEHPNLTHNKIINQCNALYWAIYQNHINIAKSILKKEGSCSFITAYQAVRRNHVSKDINLFIRLFLAADISIPQKQDAQGELLPQRERHPWVYDVLISLFPEEKCIPYEIFQPQLMKAMSFLKSNFMTKIQKEIVDAIQDECDRLKKRHYWSTPSSVDQGNIKVRQFREVLNFIKTDLTAIMKAYLINGEIAEEGKSNDETECSISSKLLEEAIQSTLRKRLQTLIHSPDICQERSTIGSYIRHFIGLFLKFFGGSESYQATFFRPASVSTAIALHKTLSPKNEPESVIVPTPSL